MQHKASKWRCDLAHGANNGMIEFSWFWSRVTILNWSALLSWHLKPIRGACIWALNEVLYQLKSQISSTFSSPWIYGGINLPFSFLATYQGEQYFGEWNRYRIYTRGSANPKKVDHKILIVLLGLVGDEDLKLGRPKNLVDPKPNILNAVVSFPCPCTVEILFLPWEQFPWWVNSLI